MIKYKESRTINYDCIQFCLFVISLFIASRWIDMSFLICNSVVLIKRRTWIRATSHIVSFAIWKSWTSHSNVFIKSKSKKFKIVFEQSHSISETRQEWQMFIINLSLDAIKFIHIHIVCDCFLNETINKIRWTIIKSNRKKKLNNWKRIRFRQFCELQTISIEMILILNDNVNLTTRTKIILNMNFIAFIKINSTRVSRNWITSFTISAIIFVSHSISRYISTRWVEKNETANKSTINAWSNMKMS